VGQAKDAQQIQTNVVRVDGQRSVYIPILKQAGGDTNTIAVVDGVKSAVGRLLDVPKQLVTSVEFDQSLIVKKAIDNLRDEGLIGLALTAIMILIFLGSMRATAAVLLSIPLSALATFIILAIRGSSINTMILGGLALAFSRLIDNSVIVLENIFRHLEMGEPPDVAAEKGGDEVALAVLAATLTTIMVFFPVVFLYGVSRFLFVALALAVVISLFASYFVAMTVVPLFCARFIKGHFVEGHSDPIIDDAITEDVNEHYMKPKKRRSLGAKFNIWFNHRFETMLNGYQRALKTSLTRPFVTVLGLTGIFVVSLSLYPKVGVAFFPRTEPGQFVINVKAPTGTRIEVTEQEIKKVEQIVRETVPAEELGIIVSNIGITPDFSAMYTSNSAQHTAFVQVALKEDHRVGSYEYMNRVRERVQAELPELNTYFQSGGLVDAVLNLGLPAPIDIQVGGSNMEDTYKTATEIAQKIRGVKGVSDVLIPQDIDYPALQMNIDRVRAGELGLSQREVVNNVITALTSNGMIAPSFWVDPKSGNDYMLTVQYPENQIKDLSDLKAIPLRSPGQPNPARLDAVSSVKKIESPTEVDHYQLRRVIDIYVAPTTEDLGQVSTAVDSILKNTTMPAGVKIDVRGMVNGMNQSFSRFGLGLILAVLLVYLILVAQFKSFMDPFLILLAVPTGLTGVLLILYLTGTTLNVMSLMGIVMMVGMVVSNSILIVEFIRHLRKDGMAVRDAVIRACRVRLRPVLMTSLATIIGLLPMALKLETGSEAYAPLARSIIGGLSVSVVLTIFIVPAAYLIVYRNSDKTQSGPLEPATEVQ
jgi:multidrug efflux pump subunit AcrB